MSTQDRHLDILQNILGPEGLIRDAEQCRQAGRDWRGVYEGSVLAIAKPKTIEEAARVIQNGL